MTMNFELEFDTSFHQFYLSDKDSLQDTGDINFWTEDAAKSRLAIGNGILGIGLECYGHFNGEVVFLDKKKDRIDYNEYDHIVEGGIDIKFGILQILDCPDSNIELEIKMPIGKYRVRVYSLNLDSVIEDSGNDYYRIEMWQDTDMELSVLKQFGATK